jgi:LemA protein
MTALWVIIAIVVVVGLWLVFAYNGLVGARNRTQESWSQIDVELKRRHDLIPNLVETAKGYVQHERGTLEAVTQARAAAVAAGQTGDVAKIGQAENLLTQNLRSLFAVAENYPDLKAIAAFTQLQEQLTATEDKIEYARRYYNTSARDFNTRLQSFPTNTIGGMFGFTPFAFFQADEADREPVKVDFSAPPGASATTPPASTT